MSNEIMIAVCCATVVVILSNLFTFFVLAPAHWYTRAWNDRRNLYAGIMSELRNDVALKEERLAEAQRQLAEMAEEKMQEIQQRRLLLRDLQVLVSRYVVFNGRDIRDQSRQDAQGDVSATWSRTVTAPPVPLQAGTDNYTDKPQVGRE